MVGVLLSVVINPTVPTPLDGAQQARMHQKETWRLLGTWWKGTHHTRMVHYGVATTKAHKISGPLRKLFLSGVRRARKGAPEENTKADLTA